MGSPGAGRVMDIKYEDIWISTGCFFFVRGWAVDGDFFISGRAGMGVQIFEYLDITALAVALARVLAKCAGRIRRAHQRMAPQRVPTYIHLLFSARSHLRCRFLQGVRPCGL